MNQAQIKWFAKGHTVSSREDVNQGLRACSIVLGFASTKNNSSAQNTPFPPLQTSIKKQAKVVFCHVLQLPSKLTCTSDFQNFMENCNFLLQTKLQSTFLRKPYSYTILPSRCIAPFLGGNFNVTKTLKWALGFLQWTNLIRNHANSCCSSAVFPHGLYYSSLTSPTALNDVMGSAAQRDERDKAEPAGTGESFQHTIHNTAWELKSYRSSHSTPSVSESCAFSQHKKGKGGKSKWSIFNKRAGVLKGRI